jgi:NTP pyrophosphatase (non-canonical NTP hydrolase)
MPDLNDMGYAIACELHANGFEPDGGVRQALNLLEEAGELVGAYRRWTGRARRAGTEQDFRLELADVVITAFVTAAEAGYRLDVPDLIMCPARLEPTMAYAHMVGISAAVQWFAGSWSRSASQGMCKMRLQGVVDRAYHLAGALGLDLEADIAAKLEIVFSRGWREPASS